ncbi:arginine--tRNA ligase [Paenibacillus oenotherae]|uniref:arginine--tRNA ligase n=1 Tax=Paenibacillus oenotherae TaxID=1435645 RepID=UPI003CCEB5C4
MLLEWSVEKLQPYVELTSNEIFAVLEVPPRPELGDVAFPCYALARKWKKSPEAIAGELADRFNAGASDVRAEAAGSYLNLFFDPRQWAPRLLAAALEHEYGYSADGEGERVVIDLSSPNIAKPFGVGHLRSTMIGNALANLYRASGYEVVTVNHIGDWGTQFGKLMAAYKRWGDEEQLKQSPIRESLRLYVKFHEETEQDETLEDEGRRWFWRLENGDPEALKLWHYFVSFSLEEFERVYARLGVTFNHTLGESFYNDKMGAVVEQLREQQLLVESDGAQVVRLDDQGIPPCLILKSDGTTIYPTRDLATALYRRREMKADRLLYVVGGEQKLHFQQVFSVLQRMGMDWAVNCEHIPFGLMKIDGRKMSTRKGQVVYLDTVLDEAVRKAEAIIEEKNAGLANRREVAEAVGIGAIVFNDLKHSRMLEVDFSLDEAIRFEGETGPYVQYTAARCYKLLRTGMTRGLAVDEIAGDSVYLTGPAAWDCLKMLGAFPAMVKEALRVHEPSVLARYLLDVSQSFNRFYHQERVLSESTEETLAKLGVVAATVQVLRTGLELLGLKAPQQI